MASEMMAPPTLTVITATKNCADLIDSLIDSLKQQTDPDFAWLVADGCSSDSTVAKVGQSGLSNVSISSEPDFSIYDALNRAVRLCTSDYYLVVGADDVILPDCISNYRKAASDLRADLVVAAVETFKSIRLPMSGKRWLRGGNAICASHSVGTLIRRDLHERLGYYSNRYPNAADMHFVMKCVSDRRTKVAAAGFLAGSFSNGGISSTDELTSLCDFFRLQVAFGERSIVQIFLHGMRITRACWRISRRSS